MTHKEVFLKIVGDGPLKKQIEDRVGIERIPNIEFTGRKSHSESMEILKDALFMVTSSIWYEMFPMTVLETFSCGKAVIAPRLGALAEIVQEKKTGLLFEPGNAEDLALKIKWMVENEDACIEMGKNARQEFEERYTAEKNFKILMDIYKIGEI
jgi:Glycosyltransferase